MPGNQTETNTSQGFLSQFKKLGLQIHLTEKSGGAAAAPKVDLRVSKDILTFALTQLPANHPELEEEIRSLLPNPQHALLPDFLRCFGNIEERYKTAYPTADPGALSAKVERAFTGYAGADPFIFALTSEAYQLVLLQEYIAGGLAQKLLFSISIKKVQAIVTRVCGTTVLKATRVAEDGLDFALPEEGRTPSSEWLRLANDTLTALTQALFIELRTHSGEATARSQVEEMIQRIGSSLSKWPSFHMFMRMLPSDTMSAGYLEEMSKAELELEVQKRTAELSLNAAKLQQLILDNANLVAFPENNPNPILGVSKDGTILYANPSTEKLKNQLNLKSLEELLPPAHFSHVQQALSGKQQIRGESKVAEHTYEWLYVPFKDMIHLYASDITDKKRIELLLDESNQAAKLMIKKEQALTKANENLASLNTELSHVGKELVSRDLALTEANNRLISLDKMKSEFVSVAAHQLRTPLTGIRWTLHALIDKEFGETTPKQEQFIRTALKTVVGAIDLINDLLNVARIEEGRFGYIMKPGNITDVLKACIERFSHVAQDKGVRLSFEQNGQIPDTILDAEKITMAFDNLIDNAIKYTDAGGTVSVGLYADTDRIRAIVSDSGIGVPEIDQKKMFIKFFRAGNAQLLHTSGTGLGLYIVKNIIEKHRGSISFESGQGKGTTFTITLPINTK